jgi:serine phosphatase RsbU (regulator of sigma subunit)
LLVVEDATSDERFAANPYVTGDPNVRFYAGQPLEAPGGERLGTLCILDDRPRALSDPDRRLLQELATWVERELTINEELDRAAEVQRGLLPRSAPVVPGYELAAACIPSRAVGGDFFDWYEVPGGLELTVADVMGKGLGAAIMTAGVRGVLRAAARTDGVAAAVDAAAATLEPDLEETSTIVTLFHARLRAEDGLLRYADAGHGLTLVVRADGTAERATSLGLPLGALRGERWEEHELRIGPGDTLVTVSDGALDLYGGVLADLDDVAERVRSAASATQVVDVVRARAEEAALLDDVTIVVIRRFDA